MTSNVHATEHPANPRPAPGQIWRFADGAIRTVKWVGEPRTVQWVEEPGFFYLTAVIDEGECVGVSTPHGRVMVGERRRSYASGILYTILGVISGARNLLRLDGGPGGRALAQEEAAFVATWPLVTESALRVLATQMPSPEDVANMRALLTDWATRSTPSCVLPVGYDSVTIGGITLPDWTWPDASVTELDPATLADKIKVPLEHPRAERERRRREIDAVMREMVATDAERAAVLAWDEHLGRGDPRFSLDACAARVIVDDLRARCVTNETVLRAYDRGRATTAPAPVRERRGAFVGSGIVLAGDGARGYDLDAWSLP